MTDQISTLGLAVDTTGLKSASGELDNVTQAGDRTRVSLDRVEALLANIDASSRSMAQALSAAVQSTKDVSATAKAADDAGRRLLDTLREQSALYGKSAEDVLRYRAAQAGVASEAAPLIAQLEKQRAAQRGAAEAALSEYQAQREAAQAKSLMERAQQSFIAGLREQAETMGKSRKELLEYRAAQLGVSDQAAPLIKRFADLDKAGQGVGVSSKMAAFQAQQLSYQLNDLFVQIASGQSPITAIIQQGSQLSGSFGGIGAAARAAGGFVLGLINPLTLTVGAAAALAYAYERGAQEGREFSKTLILTGNAAGTTVDALGDMAAQVNKLGAGTVGRAAEVLNQLASGGKVAASSLTAFSAVALNFERSGGQAVEETVKAFADLGKTPLQSTLRLNDSMNYLTRSTYEQIRALEQQGRTTEAANVAQKAYADALQQRTPQMEANLGLIEKAWRAIKDVTKGAGDAALSIGRPETLESQISNLEAELKRLADLRKPSSGGFQEAKDSSGYSQAEVDARRQLDALRQRQQLENGNAKAAAESAKQVKARADWDAEGLQYLTSREQLERAIVLARNKGLEIGASEAEIQDRITRVRRAGDPGAGEALQIARIDDTKRNLNSLVAAYQDAESVLEANRQAGLIGERDYYNTKVGFIKLNAEAQRRILEEDTKAQEILLNGPNVMTAESEAINARIKDNDAEMVNIQKRATTEAVNLTTQQATAQAALVASYEQSKAAAEDYLRTFARANQRDLAGFGLGNEERSRLAGRRQIADKYDDERARLDADIELAKTRNGGELNSDQAERFTGELNLITSSREKALALYDDYYDKLKAKQADASLGASEAIRNYVDDQKSAARAMQEAYGRAFSSIEDTLTQFIRTGKLNFKSLADTILTEMARVEARRIVAGYSSSIGSILGQAFNAIAGGGLSMDTSVAGNTGGINGGTYLPDLLRGGRALGGPVNANQTYEVNERDVPEIVRTGGRDYMTMGNQGGQVTPLDSSRLGQTINITIGAGVQRAELAAFVPELTRQIKAAVMAEVSSPVRR